MALTKLHKLLAEARVTLLIGQYAQAYPLGARRGKIIADMPRACREYLPGSLAIPHPSPRNRGWFAPSAWFERDVLPVLRRRVRTALGGML